MKPGPDMLAMVTFYPTDKGGRKGPTPDTFACPLEFGGEQFDARFDLSENGAIKPGETVKLPVKFLSLGLAKSQLAVGEKFKLWEGGTIGEGEILEIYDYT